MGHRLARTVVLIVLAFLSFIPSRSYAWMMSSWWTNESGDESGYHLFIYRDAKTWDRSGQGAVPVRAGYYVVSGLSNEPNQSYRFSIHHCINIPTSPWLDTAEPGNCSMLTGYTAFSNWHSGHQWAMLAVLQILESPVLVQIMDGGPTRYFENGSTGRRIDQDNTRFQLNAVIGLLVALCFLVAWRVYI